MADVETPRESKPRRDVPRRMWIPITALALAAAGMIGVQFVAPDRVAVGDRRGMTFMIGAAGFLAVAAWFFFGSGISRRTRAIVAVALVAAIAAVFGAVRRVEFSGDMTPTFDFRWNTDRVVLLEEHRARQEARGALPLAVEAGPEDVLEYRGPRREGIVPGPRLARDWKSEPPRLVWRQPVGGGYASFVVVGPTLVTIEQRRDKEAVVAYDADTGAELWVYDYPALFSETLGGDGPRATPTLHDGKLYALGASGVLSCIDFATGKALWSFNILTENECGNLDWGMSGSPLVYDDVVLVNPGNQKGKPTSRSIVAYDLADGKRSFAGGETKAGYASPVLAELAGVRQILVFDGVGLAGFDPIDGRELWRYPWKSDWDINASQPIVVDGERVLITSNTGAALVKLAQAIDRPWVTEVWRNRNMKCGYSSPILYAGHVYGLDENMLACIELETGKRKWKAREGQYGHGQILLRDGLLVILGEAGELALVEASPERFTEVGRIQAIEGKTWNVPVLVGPRIFVRNHLEMAAYELPVEKAGEEKAEGGGQKAEESESNPEPETPNP